MVDITKNALSVSENMERKLAEKFEALVKTGVIKHYNACNSCKYRFVFDSEPQNHCVVMCVKHNCKIYESTVCDEWEHWLHQ